MSEQETAYRSANLVYRAGEGDAPGIIEGRMVPYGEWAEIRSAFENRGIPFMERIMSGALTKTIAERAHRMRILFHHGLDVLGKQPIATLDGIRDDEEGPWYQGTLLRSVPGLIMEGLVSGIYGTSIAMRNIKAEVVRNPGKSDFNPQGLEERTVTEARIDEISVTAFPVYEGATAGVRSLTDEFYGAVLVQRHPELLLQIVRAQTEPEHSEPPTPEDPEDGKASRSTQSEDEPSRPRKDWLSTEKEAPAWRLP